MTAGYVDLFLDRGTDFNHTINLSDDNTNAPINIANYEIYCSLKKSYYSENVYANVTCTIINAANGEFSITMNRGVTSNIEPGRYVFDVVTLAGNLTEKVLEGVFHVAPTVTIIG